MAKDLKGFLKIKRAKTEYRPVCERVKDYDLVFKLRSEPDAKEQAARCMDCGTPFCHWACPLCNLIPEWNDAAQANEWKKAFTVLNATNPLPEITGRVCPALCEFACVLGVNDEPVTIRENELSIVEQAFKNGKVMPRKAKKRTGYKIAVVGSGPAGLAAASELNLLGHSVTVFEKEEKIGGIMRFGIPDFKLEKKILDRRIAIWKKEGVKFVTGVNVVSGAKLKKEFDAVLLAGGSRKPRDLGVEGRSLKGVYFAMEYLMQSNRKVGGVKFSKDQSIDAKGKKVLVIGGGDTGSDCVGTANRQGAACVYQIELLPLPPKDRPENQPWPKYPFVLKTSSSHEEGADRQWSIMTKKFSGENGMLKRAHCVKVDSALKEIPGTDFVLEIDLAFLALGFLHPEHEGLLDALKVKYDQRGNVEATNYQTSVKGVFAAGDMRRGQSLIVWALAEGVQAARAINEALIK